MELDKTRAEIVLEKREEKYTEEIESFLYKLLM
jgi:hypothetical protein